VFAIGPDEKRYVSTLKPRYLIENKTTETTVRDVTTGSAPAAGASSPSPVSVHRPRGAGKTAPVENVEVPGEYLTGLH